MKALHNPLRGIYRVLIPSFPTKNQGVKHIQWEGWTRHSRASAGWHLGVVVDCPISSGLEPWISKSIA